MFGAVIGDIVGSKYEFNNIKTKEFPLFSNGCCFTDDTVMTVAVAEVLKNGWHKDKDKIVDTFKKWGRANLQAGFGNKFFLWLVGSDREPYNSCGNGSAMRVSPVGWYANSEEEVKQLSKAVTEVTHNHPEGLKGAEVTAMCVYYARTGKSKEFIREYIEKNYNVDFDYFDLIRNFQHLEETCQVTVPQALYCFLISNSFEDCLRTTIAIGGDCDTTAAISCAIAEAYYGIPEEIKQEAMDYLEKEMINILEYK